MPIPNKFRRCHAMRTRPFDVAFDLNTNMP